MRKISLLLLCYILFQACVEPFNVSLPITQKILIVDGTITDLPTDQFVTLRISDPKLSNSVVFAVRDANVTVVANDKDVIQLTDRNKDGVYYFPAGFRPSYNVNYKLKIRTKEGVEYESGNEAMVQGPKIDKVYEEFRNDGIVVGNSTAPAHYIYLDTKDPAGVKNNYFWNWRLWERQDYCVTCSGGRYFYNARTRVWECRDEGLEVDYDYACDRSCWDVFYNNELNILNDIYSDGRDIKARLVAKIPYYQYNGALVEITQQSVSATAYRYLKLLVEQGQNTGSLADTPPAALVGNIRNINDPTESVGGIFMVSSTQTQLFWLKRNDVPQGSKNAIGLLGRPANPEPPGPDITRPPLAACNNSKFRTNVKPIGWRD
jgi:hypothetical protein